MRFSTVTEFLEGLNGILSGIPALIEGEVSQFSIRQEKWCFFTLKDEGSVVECFMPVWKLRHEVEDGMMVRIGGIPRIYEKNGRFRITVEKLDPAGEGSLRRAFELLCQKLDGEGLFAPERKRPLPRFPERIGLIASRESAAYSDFLRILENRWGDVEVLVQDVRVQGEGAVEEIVTALCAWNDQGPETHDQIPDVLILTRGGGSLEDLQAFNSEEIARAIFASPIPVVVGVGHERDVTIADLVADVRASTPSNAAERAVPDRREIAAEVDAMEQCMVQALEQRMVVVRHAHERFLHVGSTFAAEWNARVTSSMQRVEFRMSTMWSGARQRCMSSQERVLVSMRAMRTQLHDRIVAMQRLLENLNPDRLLARGYSVTRVGGRIVRDVSTLTIGDILATQLAEGNTTSTVTGVDHDVQNGT